MALQRDGACIACVRQEERLAPKVANAAFYPADHPASALEEIARDYPPARFQFTHLLNPGDYQILSVEAPAVPPAEMKAAIRWRLKDLLDFHVDDASIDVLDVPVHNGPAARNRLMLAVVARNQLIQQRQQLFENARIPLSVIDIPEMAQRNLSALQAQQDRGIALLCFHSEGGLLTISFNGELYLSRRLEISLPHLQQAGDVEECYERITVELQRSFDHFERQFRFITLSSLRLSPMENVGDALQAHLAGHLDLPVETMQLSSAIDFSLVPELRQTTMQQRFFWALGAALREEEVPL